MNKRLTVRVDGNDLTYLVKEYDQDNDRYKVQHEDQFLWVALKDLDFRVRDGKVLLVSV